MIRKVPLIGRIDEWVKSVRSDNDTLSVDLMDDLSTGELLRGARPKSQFIEAKWQHVFLFLRRTPRFSSGDERRRSDVHRKRWFHDLQSDLSVRCQVLFVRRRLTSAWSFVIPHWSPSIPVVLCFSHEGPADYRSARYGKAPPH